MIHTIWTSLMNLRAFYQALLPVALALVAPGLCARGESGASLARQGNAFYKQGNIQQATDAYRQALIRNPENTLFKYNLGTALSKGGQTAEAQQTLSEAAEMPGAPRRRDAFFNMGVALGQAAQKLPKNAGAPSPAPGGAPLPGMGANPGGPAAAAPDPVAALQQKVAMLEQSLGAFRKTILTDPKDEDAKYNYETVQAMLRQAREEMQQQQKNQQGQKNNKDQKDQQNQQNQQKDQNGKNNSQNQNRQDQNKNPSQNGQQPQPNNQQGGDPQNGDGSDGKSEQLKPEQVDALGLLNMLENQKPEEFKKLYRLQSPKSETTPPRDW